jgi:microcin C transport system ATP-binding protein
MRSTPEKADSVMPGLEATAQTGASPLLSIQGLGIEFVTSSGPARVVHDVSLDIATGERVALVGESGSGKTITALSVLQLNLDARYQGRILFNGQNLLEADQSQLRKIRGREISFVFQEPMSALNPLFTAGDQVAELLERHEGLTRGQALQQAEALLARTQIADPKRCAAAYPHELSGGQRQRVVIAMALACQPRLLIADEPTTALDVTVQRQIVGLLDSLQQEFGMSVLLITHDLPLVQRFADRVAVMQAGRLVEAGPTAEVFARPAHAYTRRLIDSRPRRMVEVSGITPGTLLQAQSLSCRFSVRKGWFKRESFEAVRPLDLRLGKGQTLGIVGESGSGKTTLGMSLLYLSQANVSGGISFRDNRLDQLSRSALRPLRRAMQVVFQDPYNSLSPRMTVGSIVSEGLALHHPEMSAAERDQTVREMLTEVGLAAEMADRYPHEFSGGQRQRIAIARAAVLQPALMLLDEPTSALDVSVQQQVLELLVDLQIRYGMSYLFISHDLAVIRAVAHQVIVMRAGEVVEAGDVESVFESPRHDYTRELLAAAWRG